MNLIQIEIYKMMLEIIWIKASKRILERIITIITCHCKKIWEKTITITKITISNRISMTFV